MTQNLRTNPVTDTETQDLVKESLGYNQPQQDKNYWKKVIDGYSDDDNSETNDWERL